MRLSSDPSKPISSHRSRNRDTSPLHDYLEASCRSLPLHPDSSSSSSSALGTNTFDIRTGYTSVGRKNMTSATRYQSPTQAWVVRTRSRSSTHPTRKSVARVGIDCRRHSCRADSRWGGRDATVSGSEGLPVRWDGMGG